MEEDYLRLSRDNQFSTQDTGNEEHSSSSDPILSNVRGFFGLEDLSDVQDTPTPSLLTVLKQDERWQRRAAAARRLGELEGTDTLEALLESLEHDTSPEVRATTARALGKTQSPLAELALALALQHREAEVRVAAAQALRHYTTHLSQKTVHMLIERFFCEDEAYARAAIVTALGELGDPAALPVLQQLSCFTGEDFFDLPHESRAEYRIYEIGEKTLTAIERLTQKSVVTEKGQHKQLQQIL